MSDPLHVAITRKVKPGCESAFGEAILRFFASSFSHVGTLGAYLMRPLPGSDHRTYGILGSLASEADRDAFYASEGFRHWQQTVLHLVETDYSHRPLHGLEAFFRQGRHGCGGALLVGWMPMRIVGAETWSRSSGQKNVISATSAG